MQKLPSNDVYVTSDIFRRMVWELAKQGLKTVGDLLHAQGGPIFAPPPPDIWLPSLIRNALSSKQSLRIRYLGNSAATERIITP
jgi:hypothetical protein